MKQVRIYLLMVCTWFAVQLNAQEASPVLVTVEDEEVTVAEFEAIYGKNSSQAQNVEEKTAEEYLELFINFRLKVKEAETLGLDTLSSFKNELNGYVKQLKEPYLIDQEYNEALIKEAYNRMLQDVKASHILVRVDANASPEDTLAAYKKIQSIREELKSGADFVKIAVEKSEDPSAKDNKGLLGYFTVFRMVYPFESAAYSTPVGELSKIIRTDYGYHILKVHDKRDAMGQVRAAHIMVRPNPEQREGTMLEQKINEIYERLEAGEDFALLAKTYSDDKASARRGGEMPWFGAGRMVPAFEEAVYGLEEGAYSKPFQTKFGWHIVKLLERKPIGTFDEVKPMIEEKITKDQRGSNSRKMLVEKLKNNYRVKIWEKSLAAFYELPDTAVLEANWDYNGEWNKKLMRIDDRLYGKKKITYTQDDFAKYLKKQLRKTQNESVKQIIDKQFEAFVEDRIIQYESSILDKKYAKYAKLVNEYRDGILLFDLMDQKVWTKAIKDSTGLEQFYEENKLNFMWDERVKATIYTCSSEDHLNAVNSMIEQGNTDSAIIAEVNKSSQLAVKIDKGTYEKKDKAILEQIKWEVGVQDPIEMNDNYILVKIHEVLPPMEKALDEARGLITAKYQEYLEEQWINELREKYTVEVNEEALKTVNIQ